MQSTLSSWYNTLRYISIVGLLIVLVYVGIKILISSNTSQKAKYKQMLMDWLIALILVVLMHYIMAFIMSISERITDGLGKSTLQYYYDESTGKFAEKNLLENWYKAQGYDVDPTGGENGTLLITPDGIDMGSSFGYIVVYSILIALTGIFLWQYLRRVVMMAFLTVIGPFVCLTYPIDKMRDGSAQAFDMWFREYLFNALIQPFHLVVYAVLFGIASDLSNETVIFTIAVLAFMIPAEKFLRNMFGFNKAQTFGAFAGAAAGSLFGNAMRMLGKQPPKPRGKGDNAGIGGADREGKIRIAKDNDIRNLSGFKDPNANLNGNQSNALGSLQGTNTNIPSSLSNTAAATAGAAMANAINNQNQGNNVTSGVNYSALLQQQNAQQQPQGDDQNGNSGQNAASQGQTAQYSTSIPTNSSTIPSNVATSTNNNRKPVTSNNAAKPKRKINGVAKNTGRMFKRGLRRYVTDRNHGVRRFLRGVGRGAGALAGATIGLGFGLASGELSKGIAGAAIGYTGGGSLGERIGDLPATAVNGAIGIGTGARDFVDSVKDIGYEMINGDDATRAHQAERQLARDRREYLRSDATITQAEKFKDTYFANPANSLKADGTEMSIDDIANEMYNLERAGVTDEADMQKAFILMNKGFRNEDAENPAEQAANILQEAKKINKDQLSDRRYHDMIRNSIKSRVGDSEEVTDQIMSGIYVASGLAQYQNPEVVERQQQAARQAQEAAERQREEQELKEARKFREQQEKEAILAQQKAVDDEVKRLAAERDKIKSRERNTAADTAKWMGDLRVNKLQQEKAEKNRENFYKKHPELRQDNSEENNNVNNVIGRRKNRTANTNNVNNSNNMNGSQNTENSDNNK